MADDNTQDEAFHKAEQCKQWSGREGEWRENLRKGECTQPKQPSGEATEREGEQSQQPSEQGEEQPEQASGRKRECSKRESVGEGENSKDPSELKTQDECCRLLEEVKEWMEIAIKQDRQSKKEELIKTIGECKKMLEKASCLGGQSMQTTECEKANDSSNLLAQIKKVDTEIRKEQNENDIITRDIKGLKDMKTSIQHFLSVKHFLRTKENSVYPDVQQAEQLTVRDEEQAEQPTVQIAEHAERPTVPEGEQAAQPAVQEKEQALQPAIQEEQQAEQPSEWEGGHSKRGNEQKHEQFEQQKKTKAIRARGNHQGTIIFKETIGEEGFTWDYRESGIRIKFSPKAVPKPKLFTCSLWYPSADSLHLEADESLVSNVIELTCDDSKGVKFSGITVALSHSAVYMGGYELVMKELTGPENDTWKTLNTTSVSLDPSEPLLENSDGQSDLQFVQATITNLSSYAVICRRKSYKFSFDASMTSTELTWQVPSPISDCSDVRVTIPRKSLPQEDGELTMKVQEVPDYDFKDKRAFVGLILHISSPVDMKLKEPASIKIPIALEQDLQKLQSLSISTQDSCSTQDSSQKWVDITEDLKPPAKLENGTVTFEVNHFPLNAVILVCEVSERAGILERLKFGSSVPQRAGFLACLCSTGNPDEHLLVLCCYPLHMVSEVWKEVSSRYTVIRHGQDTSRHSLNREDEVSFTLPDAFSPCEQIDMENKFLSFLGHEAFQTSFKVPANEIKSAVEITFFKRNGLQKALCTLVIVLASPAQHDRPSTSNDMPGYQDLLTQKLIRRILDDVGNCWHDLGVELDIEEGILQNIDKEYNKMREKARNMLILWKQKAGTGAMVGRLASALIAIGHKWIADKLPDICQSIQEQEGRQSKQQSERKGEQIKQPSEPEAPDDIFILLKEVQELRKRVTGLKEGQPKERDGEQAKQPTRWEGEQSKQKSEQEAEDDLLSLLVEIQEMTKIAIKRKRKKSKEEILKKIIEDTEEMKKQVQQLIKRNNSESK